MHTLSTCFIIKNIKRMKSFLVIFSVFLFCTGSLFGENPDTHWKADTTGEFISITSKYMAVSFYKKFPMMSYFNVESGGRSSRILDKSLLKPGEGGLLVEGNQLSFGKNARAEYKEGEINYHNVCIDKKFIDCTFSVETDKQFKLKVKGDKHSFKGEFFRMYTAPDISPMSIWAKKTAKEASSKYDKPVSVYSPEIRKTCNRLPAVLHFPDYGMVRVSSSDSNVYIQQHFVPDYSQTGLSLGQYNFSGHLRRKAIHYGSIVLSFHSDVPLDAAEITFTVMDENYPHIKGCDFSDDRFDGLKRCWQNAFTLEPVSQSMGDNILLGGIGHLSLLFKADMYCFTPNLPCTYSMKNALKSSIEPAFLNSIGKDDLLNCGYGCESTESTLIALYDYLITTNDWDFVKKYIPSIRRLVTGIIATDKDHDGIFEDPFDGNGMREHRESLNWWDNFAFGYKDAYVNLLAYRALTDMGKIFEALDMKQDVKVIDKSLSKFRKVFHKTFFNPATGVYAGWISKDGKVHDYMFTFINAMAINLDLVPNKEAKNILSIMLKKLDEEGYNYVYGIPGPLISVPKQDNIDWPPMSDWGRYENGGLCGQTAYHFIQALYKTGMREDADKILFTMMNTFEKEATHSGLNPGYGLSVDWRTKEGRPCGYNYLADNYYFLLAAITGYYGVEFPELKKPK